jgi:hypothetical protein
LRRENPVLWSQRRASQESWTAAGYGSSGANLQNQVRGFRLGVERRKVPIIHRNHNTSRSLAKIRTNRILRLNVAQYPAPTMIIHHYRPSVHGSLSLGSKDANWDIRTPSLFPLDLDIFCFSNRKFGTTTGN